jgi:hypothetical protein
MLYYLLEQTIYVINIYCYFGCNGHPPNMILSRNVSYHASANVTQHCVTTHDTALSLIKLSLCVTRMIKCYFCCTV